MNAELKAKVEAQVRETLSEDLFDDMFHEHVALNYQVGQMMALIEQYHDMKGRLQTMFVSQLRQDKLMIVLCLAYVALYKSGLRGSALSTEMGTVYNSRLSDLSDLIDFDLVGL